MEMEPDPAHRIFVSYIDKSRAFYGAQGYANPYRWAHHDEAPFARLTKPLSECQVGVVTTSSPWPEDGHTGGRGQDLGGAYAMAAEPPPSRMYTDHRSWDKEATHTRDLETFLPLTRLKELAAEKVLGSVSPRFYGVPTEYSQRRTREVDAPRVLKFLKEDRVDAAVLVPL